MRSQRDQQGEAKPNTVSNEEGEVENSGVLTGQGGETEVGLDKISSARMGARRVRRLGNICCLGVVETPLKAELGHFEGIPSPMEPSDHVPLVALFEVTPGTLLSID
ncbi:unnamed protein product [Choristocarpus tenellus]